MSRRSKAAAKATARQEREMLARDFAPWPLWPTTMRTALRDGRLVGTANDGSNKIGSVWLARMVPMMPVLDSKTAADLDEAAAPLEAAFSDLAALASANLKRRTISQASYREFHLLLANVPRRFRPPADHPLHDRLQQDFGDQVVDHRALMFAVRLNPSVTGSATSDSWRDAFGAAVDSTLGVLVGSEGVPLSDFDRDFRTVDAILTRAGLTAPTGTQVALLNSWWNHGRSADLAHIPHADHMHFFSSVAAGQAAKKWLDADHDCDEWADRPNPEEWSVTFTTVSGFDWDGEDGRSITSAWLSRLLRLDTLAVSVRGRIEPAEVTREEIRRQKTEVIRDINERANQGKLERSEQHEMVARLDAAEDYYANTPPSASLVGVSVLAALNGRVTDLDQLQNAGRFPFRLAPMENRQPAALAETMLCSPARANPYVHDMPSQNISYSGVQSLSQVGDSGGGLLGLTENDRQPVWVSPSASARADSAPLMAILGGTGSGKSQTGLWLAYQFAQDLNDRGEQRPVIYIQPKPDEDDSPIVSAVGGRVANLDDLVSSDGMLDPLRFASGGPGIALASSMLSRLNPWGSQERMHEFEVPVLQALRYGVEHGAASTGAALLLARDHLGDQIPPGLVEPVIRLAESEPMAKSLIGINPQGDSLRAGGGLTLIQSGSASFKVDDLTATDMISKIKRAIVRNLVYGSQTALAHRQGVVFFDEAHVFLEGGKAEMDFLGRTARSQEVLGVMLTQRVADAVRAELTGYISRVLCHALEDEDEAQAALHFMRWDEAPAAMLARIRAKDRTGNAPNRASLRALVDPDTRQVHRGSVALYNDLAGRVVPVEVTIPKWFLKLSSTNPDDIALRGAAAAIRRP